MLHLIISQQRPTPAKHKGVPPWLSGFVCTYHPAIPGLSPKHTIYAFSFIVFVLYLLCEKNKNKQKEAGFGHFLTPVKHSAQADLQRRSGGPRKGRKRWRWPSTKRSIDFLKRPPSERAWCSLPTWRPPVSWWPMKRCSKIRRKFRRRKIQKDL